MEDYFECKQPVDHCESCKLVGNVPEEQTVTSRDGNCQLSGTTGQSRIDYSLHSPVTEGVQSHMGRDLRDIRERCQGEKPRDSPGDWRREEQRMKDPRGIQSPGLSTTWLEELCWPTRLFSWNASCLPWDREVIQGTTAANLHNFWTASYLPQDRQVL